MVTTTPPDAVIQQVPLGRVWATIDPFLFCVHHDDDYPEGDDELGPCVPLMGRNIGMDFSGRDGWSMYHGSSVPGFPQHPHRGFETISFMRGGFMDHSDSLGAAARFGRGDVQWMTAGGGITHSEMFPLLNGEGRNPTELFQIWINLPGRDKMVEPHFSMLWGHTIPKHTFLDPTGKPVTVTVVAGEIVPGERAPKPPPHSWAADPSNDVNIWHLDFADGASWTLPPAADGSVRVMYVFGDSSVRVGDVEVQSNHGAVLRCDVPVEVTDVAAGTEALILQAKPIGEPVVQHGPFVMNTQGEIRKAYNDYAETNFGGWPWPVQDPNHGHELKRFARHADGKVEEFEAA